MKRRRGGGNSDCVGVWRERERRQKWYGENVERRGGNILEVGGESTRGANEEEKE